MTDELIAKAEAMVDSLKRVDGVMVETDDGGLDADFGMADNAAKLIAELAAQLAAARGEVEREVLNHTAIAAKLRELGYKQFEMVVSESADEYEATYRTAEGYAVADAIARGDYRAPRIGGKEEA